MTIVEPRSASQLESAIVRMVATASASARRASVALALRSRTSGAKSLKVVKRLGSRHAT